MKEDETGDCSNESCGLPAGKNHDEQRFCPAE